MKPPSIPTDKLLALEPACLRMTVPESYRDPNGHMNMRWYVAIFDDAGDDLHLRLGLTPDYHLEHGTGTVDLEHHTHFISEVLAGDRVANAFIDLTVRRTAPFPSEIASRIAAAVDAGARLDWPAPVSGSMQV